MSAALESLRWRYAVKSYDKTRKLAPEEIAFLAEAVRLAPSSFGLQPYRVLFIEAAPLRAKLRAASFDQSQITDASHLVVFAIEHQVDEAYIRRLVGPARQDAVIASIGRKSPEALRDWAARQAYLALGFLLFAAAERRIDANPMEGFVPNRYDEILGLEGASSVVIAALGHRSEGDRFQHFPKVRRAPEDLFVHLGGEP